MKVTRDVAIRGYVPQPFVAVLPAPCFSGTYSIDLSRLLRPGRKHLGDPVGASLFFYPRFCSAVPSGRHLSSPRPLCALSVSFLRFLVLSLAHTTARGFCTSAHRFAQRFDQNLIDGTNEKHYLARQIEPGSLRTLRLSLQGAASLTAVAPRNWTAKLEASTVPFGGRASLTAGTLPDGIGKVRNFTAQFRGRSSLTAVAPSIILAWPFRPPL
jgi:hypothetical protein